MCHSRRAYVNSDTDTFRDVLSALSVIIIGFTTLNFGRCMYSLYSFFDSYLAISIYIIVMYVIMVKRKYPGVLFIKMVFQGASFYGLLWTSSQPRTLGRFSFLVTQRVHGSIQSG